MAETNEYPLVAGDTGEDAMVETRKANIFEAVKAPVAKSGKTPVAESGIAFVVEIREDSAAGCGKTAETEASNAVVVETGENSAAGTEEDHPVAEISNQRSWFAAICKNRGTAKSRARHLRPVLLRGASRWLPPKQPIFR